MLHSIYFFSTNITTEYFKHAAHSPFFSSKCRLFHNGTFFGSCIIQILHTGCAKIWMLNSSAKRLRSSKKVKVKFILSTSRSRIRRAGEHPRGQVTSALGRSEGSVSCPDPMTPGEGSPSTRWTGSWVVLTSGVDDGEKGKFYATSGIGTPDHQTLATME
jgi:hypothetical protein